MRHLISTAIVAIIVSLLTVTAVGVIAQEPAQVGPAAVRNINVHKVDGKHAVGASAGVSKRRNKLVATNSSGYLPNNIIKKARNADKLDGLDSSIFARWFALQSSAGAINQGDNPVHWKQLKGVPGAIADGNDKQGVTGVKIIRRLGNALSIDAGDTGTATASCPTGSKAVGGGFSASSTDVIVYVNHANSNATHWIATARNVGGISRGLSAVVQCMSTTPSAAISTVRKGAKSTSVK